MEEETSRGQLQNLYVRRFEQNLDRAVWSIIEHNCQYVELRESKVLQIPAESEDESNQKKAVLEIERKATAGVHSGKRQSKYVSIQAEWFAEYIGAGM